LKNNDQFTKYCQRHGTLLSHFTGLSMQPYNADPTNQASANECFQPVQISLSPDVSRDGLTYWEGLKRDLQHNIVNIYHANP
jgi:hypothetical protein